MFRTVGMDLGKSGSGNRFCVWDGCPYYGESLRTPNCRTACCHTVSAHELKQSKKVIQWILALSDRVMAEIIRIFTSAPHHIADFRCKVTWKDDPQLGAIHSCFSSGFLRMYSSVVGRVLEGQRHHQRNQVGRDSKRAEGHEKKVERIAFQWDSNDSKEFIKSNLETNRQLWLPHLVISIHLNFLHLNTFVDFLHLQPQMISGTRQDFQWLRAYSGFAGAPSPDLSLKKLWKNEGSEQFQHRDSWIVWISAFGFGKLRQLSLEIVALKLIEKLVVQSLGNSGIHESSWVKLVWFSSLEADRACRSCRVLLAQKLIPPGTGSRAFRTLKLGGYISL